MAASVAASTEGTLLSGSACLEGHAGEGSMALMKSKSQTAPQNVVVRLCVTVLEITGHTAALTRNGEEGRIDVPPLVLAGWSMSSMLGF